MARHPRIAVSSPHMSTHSFAELLPRVAEHFAVWEVFGEGQQYLFDIEDTFRELTPSYDLTYTAHAPISDINIASFHPEIRALAIDIVRRTIESAGRLGIPTLTIHPGLRMPMARWDDAKLRHLTLDAAHDLAKVADDVGVTLCLENMAKNWVMTFQDPDWFADAFGRHEALRFCFDVAHSHTNGDGYTRRFVSDFTSQCGNVHVSDNEGDLDSHWVLGQGNVPLDDVVKELESRGYKGNYVIESNNFEEGVESIPVLERALAKAHG